MFRKRKLGPQITTTSQAGWGSSAHAMSRQPVSTFPWLPGHVCADADDGFKHLQVHVATTAFDSNDNMDAPKCHPNTRQAVLEDIMNWITIHHAIRIQWILWLNGAAGAGKSAIGRSIIDICLSQNIPIARFFFFRTDPTRNSLNPVVATLAYQLLESIPELRSIIIPKIQADALIFKKSLETQFDVLIFGPLLQLQSESLLKEKIVVFLLDGIDECIEQDEQAKLIRIVGNFVKKRAFPLIVFFGSRIENQLCIEFRSPTISDILLQLPLDTDYRADEDILRFLNESFESIKATHPYSSDLHARNWPEQTDIGKILQKASGQFIYAAVVIRFVFDATQHPAQQLEIVLGLRPSGNLTPFALLDALYRHIFSRVVHIQTASLILAWEMFTRPLRPMPWAGSAAMEIVCGSMTRHEIKVALAALAPVLTFDTSQDRVNFLHASLPDFLLDRNRSQNYHIDQATWSTNLSVLTITRIINSDIGRLENVLYRFRNDVNFSSMVISYLPHATPTPKLKELIATLRPALHWHPENFVYGIHDLEIESYLAIIHKWDFGDGVGGRVYRKQRKVMRLYYVQENYKYFPKWLLWLRRDLINIKRFRRDPMLIHQHCCAYRGPLKNT